MSESLIPDGQAVPYPPGTQYLQAEVGGQVVRCGWAGPWPPPEQMLFFLGVIEDGWAELPAEERSKQAMREWVFNGGAVYLLERDTVSQLPDSVILEPDSRVMRGAAYISKGPWEVPE